MHGDMVLKLWMYSVYQAKFPNPKSTSTIQRVQSITDIASNRRRRKLWGARFCLLHKISKVHTLTYVLSIPYSTIRTTLAHIRTHCFYLIRRTIVARFLFFFNFILSLSHTLWVVVFSPFFSLFLFLISFVTLPLTLHPNLFIVARFNCLCLSFVCVCYFRSFFLSIPKTTPANNLGAFSAVWRTFSERLHKSKHVKMEFKKRKKKKFERRTKRTNELTHIYIHLEMFTSIRILHGHQAE